MCGAVEVKGKGTYQKVFPSGSACLAPSKTPTHTSHWIRLIRKEQWGCIDHLSGPKTLGSLCLSTNPTEMFVNFIYYRVLVYVAIFHGITEKSSLTRGAFSCLRAARDSKVFDVLKFPNPLIYCRYYLFLSLSVFRSIVLLQITKI